MSPSVRCAGPLRPAGVGRCVIGRPGVAGAGVGASQVVSPGPRLGWLSVLPIAPRLARRTGFALRALWTGLPRPAVKPRAPVNPGTPRRAGRSRAAPPQVPRRASPNHNRQVPPVRAALAVAATMAAAAGLLWGLTPERGQSPTPHDQPAPPPYAVPDSAPSGDRTTSPTQPPPSAASPTEPRTPESAPASTPATSPEPADSATPEPEPPAPPENGSEDSCVEVLPHLALRPGVCLDAIGELLG